MCLRGKTAVSVRWVCWRGSNKWLPDRRLTAVSLNRLEEADNIWEILFLSLGRRCSLWQLYHWENRHLSLPECLWCGGEFCTSAFRCRSSCFSFTTCSDQEETHTLAKFPTQTLFLLAQLFYPQCGWLCAGWKEEDICPCWEIATPQLLKRPLGIMRFDTVIWRMLRKAVFQWCYLSCSVLTPCNDDLSLFSVMCSIFIYDQASFSLYYFWIYHPFFCAIPATNEKIKKRNILCSVSHIFLWCNMR